MSQQFSVMLLRTRDVLSASFVAYPKYLHVAYPELRMQTRAAEQTAQCVKTQLLTARLCGQDYQPLTCQLLLMLSVALGVALAQLDLGYTPEPYTWTYLPLTYLPMIAVSAVTRIMTPLIVTPFIMTGIILAVIILAMIILAVIMLASIMAVTATNPSSSRIDCDATTLTPTTVTPPIFLVRQRRTRTKIESDL